MPRNGEDQKRLFSKYTNQTELVSTATLSRFGLTDLISLSFTLRILVHWHIAPNQSISSDQQRRGRRLPIIHNPGRPQAQRWLKVVVRVRDADGGKARILVSEGEPEDHQTGLPTVHTQETPGQTDRYTLAPS